MYLVFIRMPGVSYRRRLRSLLLCACLRARARVCVCVCVCAACVMRACVCVCYKVIECVFLLDFYFMFYDVVTIFACVRTLSC